MEAGMRRGLRCCHEGSSGKRHGPKGGEDSAGGATRKDLRGLRGWDRRAPGSSREERLTIDDAEPDAGEGSLAGEETVPEVAGIV